MMRLLSLLLVLLTSCFPISNGYTNTRSAVVVGGGPVGLATALVLARRHGYEVTLLESNSAERMDTYDPTKAYPFLIRERGQKLTKLFPDVQQALEERGIATEGPTKIVRVPADPHEILDPEPKAIPLFSTQQRNFWIRRHEFIKLLVEVVRKEKMITLVNGATVTRIAALSDSLVEVSTDESEQGAATKKYQANLVVGSDGMKSRVRQDLAEEPSHFPRWKNTSPKGFQIKRWFSPASGLKFKTLHVNANAKVPIGNGQDYEIPFDVQTFHTIQSKFTKPLNALTLGLLPSRSSSTRPLNVIRVPEHEIWKIRDGQELRKWFQEAFPRFDFSADSSLVEQAEFDRFAETPGLSLPPCQYSPELYISSPTDDGAVLLIGDAVHTFPPDLGEGVNSGLEDALALDQKLSEHTKVGIAAKEYGKERGKEAKALVKMVRVGAPFQYNQFGGMLTVRKYLWTFNFFMRTLLNKLSLGIIPQPVFTQISDANLPYSKALFRGDCLTASLWALVIGTLLQSFGLVSSLKGFLKFA